MPISEISNIFPTLFELLGVPHLPLKNAITMSISITHQMSGHTTDIQHRQITNFFKTILDGRSSEITTIFLVGCGGGSSTPTSKTGTFLDSKVVGLSYSTDSVSVTTNENGEFEYIDGENITFKLYGQTLAMQ